VTGDEKGCEDRCTWPGCRILGPASLHYHLHDLSPERAFEPTPDDTAAPDPYAPLREFLDGALERATAGKGHQRHANGGREFSRESMLVRPFLEQPILGIPRLLGSPDFLMGQIIKKGLEARGLEPEAAMRECLDIANYAAGMWCWYREQGDQ